MKKREKKPAEQEPAQEKEDAAKPEGSAAESSVTESVIEPEEPAKEARKYKRRRALRLALLLLIVAAVAVLVDGRHVRFYMASDGEMTVECGQPYYEPGCYAVTYGKLFGESQRRLPLRVEGEVDTGKVGSYELRYIVRYLFREYETSRLVTVTDTTAPEITLLYKEGYRPSWLDGYEEEGYVAKDLCDGDLTEQVQREVFPDRIVYTVTDAAGNTATAERRPDYAVTAPEITLLGGDKLEYNACLYFTDPGFTAKDSLGNDLSGYVETEGEVIPYKPGLYELSYSISNAQGEKVSAVRTVNILPVGAPETVDPDRNTIYLTFDDGPGPYTEQLLDLLKVYGVKATFFVTCNNPDYEDMVGRAYREGHSIGVHSATHNYYSIYASEEAFFEDFNAAQNMIYEQTGSYTSLLRFPGGSSNTVSSFNSGIMTRLTQAVTDMGYQYFDWNVSSGDAGETTNTRQIAQNIIDGCTGRRASIVLQHDIKDYSVAAVEQVLIWGRNNGYSFRALDLSSPAAHHTIFN